MNIQNLNFLLPKYIGREGVGLKGPLLDKSTLERRLGVALDAHDREKPLYQIIQAQHSQLDIEEADKKSWFINIYLPKQNISTKEDGFALLREAAELRIGWDDSVLNAVWKCLDQKIRQAILEDTAAIFGFIQDNSSGARIMFIPADWLLRKTSVATQEIIRDVLKLFTGNAGDLRLEDRTQIESLLETCRPPLTDIQYMVLKSLYPDKDYSFLYKGDISLAELDSLLAECQDLNIDFIERFEDAGKLRVIVNTRKQELKSGQKVVLCIYNKSDPNSAFATYNGISDLISKGYQVCYYEVSYDWELEAIFRRTYYCNTEDERIKRPIDLVMIGAHGTPVAMSFSFGRNITEDKPDESGDRRMTANYLAQGLSSLNYVEENKKNNGDGYFSAVEWAALEDSTANEVLLAKFKAFCDRLDAVVLDLTDEEELKKLSKYCLVGGAIILQSCRTGYKRGNMLNLANILARSFPEQTIYTSTINADANDFQMDFDENDDFLDVYYGSGSAAKYVVKFSDLPPQISVPEGVVSKAVANECVFHLYSAEQVETLRSSGLKINRDIETGFMRIKVNADWDVSVNKTPLANNFLTGSPLLTAYLDIMIEPNGKIIINEVSKVMYDVMIKSIELEPPRLPVPEDIVSEDIAKECVFHIYSEKQIGVLKAAGLKISKDAETDVVRIEVNTDHQIRVNNRFYNHISNYVLLNQATHLDSPVYLDVSMESDDRILIISRAMDRDDIIEIMPKD